MEEVNYEKKKILDEFIFQVKFNNLYIHDFSTSLYTNNFWCDETLKGKRDFGNGQWSSIGRELFSKEIKNWSFFLQFSGGWVQDVSFSASGELLAFVGHDSSISVVNGANNQQ